MATINIGTYSFGMGSGMTLAEKLQKAKAMGYDGIEFLANDMDDNSVEDLKKMLDDNGLVCAGLHASMELISKNIPKIAALGGTLIVCPGHPFCDEEEAIACSKLLEEKGREAAPYGIRIGYHNHTDEFYPDDKTGKPLLEIMIEHGEKGLVWLQLDVGWAAAAGVDCEAFLKKYPGRFCSIHVKENNKPIGYNKPRSAKDASPRRRPPMELGPDGKPVMSEEMKKMFAAMKERTRIQCPMGDSSSVVNWKNLKAITDAEDPGCAWTVERENDYYDGDMLKCLADDVSWLKANL